MHEISNILQGGNPHGSPSFLLKNCINPTVGNVTFGPVRDTAVCGNPVILRGRPDDVVR